MKEDWIDLTNYREHPTQKSYQVVHFSIEEQADFFENLLTESNITYERHNEEKLNRTIYYFAVRNSDMTVVKNLNNIALGKFRSPFIPTSPLRWIVLTISFIVLALAIIGAIKNS